jgi:hypothetical protein
VVEQIGGQILFQAVIGVSPGMLEILGIHLAALLVV